MMRQFCLVTLISFLTFTIATSQDHKKQLKNANKTLGKYYLDPVANKGLLDEAISMIDGVFATDVAKADPEAWITKGQIFNEIAKSEMIKKIADASYQLNTPSAGSTALEAFEKAMTMAAKKSQTKDALAGIRENEDYSNNIAITFFQAQDYANAYKNFANTLKANEILKTNSAESRLDDETVKSDQIFYTAVAAYYGEQKEASKPLFEKLYQKGGGQSLVYEALFNLNLESDAKKAEEYLEKGRTLFPEDNGLLFAEINYYLKMNKLDVLIDKLNTAIVKEPDNLSIYNTLGNVYDQLNQQERAKGNIEKSDEYFKLAFDTYGRALAKDANNFDATYSQGALYYNKAAGMTAKLNELSNDYSSTGTKKYNAIKTEMDGYFTTALPFFIKAETLNPKDQSTLIALKEIYARNGELEKSSAYKAKLENLGN